MAGKTYDYPYVGIFSLNDISITQQEALGLKQTTGVYVTDVVAGSPADKAGVHAGDKPTDIAGLMAGGDLITAIDGTLVNSFNDFIGYLILNKVPGDKVTLTVLRGAEEIKLEVTLEKRPSQ
jgi:S1-C subfamily serine protease